MVRNRWLVALVAFSITPTAVGTPARADDPPTEWVLGQVRFEPLQPDGSRVDVDGLGAYRGVVEVQARGGLTVYNELPLEDYVKGIVEMPAAWPAAALQAQAIAARTYALNIVSGRGEICPDDNCQFYMGLFGQERDGGERWAAAVDATAGQVLLGNGQPIRAEFSASNGGRSVPGGSPYLQAVDDPDDSYSPTHRWHYTLPLGDFARFVGVPDGQSLVRISREADSIVAVLESDKPDPPPTTAAANPASTTTAPPASTSTTTTTMSAPNNTTRQRMAAGDFASAVNAGLDGPNGLPYPFPSMSFTLDTEGDQAVVDGGGWGHGRGMSQWGAYGKALRGLTASDIVAAYYGLRPSTIPPDRAAANIRVALATGRGTTAVTLTRPYRVVGDDGTVLVPLALGLWRVVPGRGGIRVVAPEASGDPLEVTGVRVTSPRRVPGSQPTVHFYVSGPAVVTVRLRGPGVGTGPDPVVLLEGGEQTVALPSTRSAGAHVITIEADGGPGRKATVEVPFGVRAHAVVFEASVETAPDRQRAAWVALACLLGVAALSGVVALTRRR